MTLERVVVIGSGRMAPGISAACAIAGSDVTIAARSVDKAEVAAKLAREFSGASANATIEAAAIQEQTFDGADAVIETIVEDFDVKADLFARVEPWVSPRTVLATNTSSFSITKCAEPVERPGLFAGFHFLNPAHVTAVVEVIAGERTERGTLESLADLGRRMGKLPLMVRRDVEGFIWNRLQFAILRECLYLLDEGVADIRSIDAAVSDGLAPRWLGSGPFATADLGGLATFAKVAQELLPLLSRETSVPEAMRSRADADDGFYRWDADTERAVADLRAHGLVDARDAIKRRRTVMPPATDACSGDEGSPGEDAGGE
jgi:3-hydroxybutyryl-CoA dehydrogenase